MNRWKASATHLLVSALVVGAIATWVLTVWYPPALLPMSGILGLIVLIACVDVVLGPLLTCVVYTPGKPSLRFDLAVIVLLQVAMLGYGLYVLAENRPVFLVASVDRLNLVTAQEIEDEDLAKAAPQWQRLSWTGPVLVGAQRPDAADQRQQLLFDSLEGRDIHVKPQFYTALENVWPTVLERAIPLPDLYARLDGSAGERIRHALSGHSPEGWRVLPIIGRKYEAAAMLVDAAGTPGELLAIDPWAVAETRSARGIN